MEIENFSKEEFGELVLKLLADVGLQDLATVENAGNKGSDNSVHQYISNKDYPEKATKLALQSAERMNVFFPHISGDHKAHLALFFALVMCVEDDEDNVELQSALNNFDYRMLSGEQQDHPILTAFVDILKDNRKYYGPYGCMMITKGVMEGFASLVVEHKFNREKKKVSRGAIQFPAYFRYKTYAIDFIAHLYFPEATLPEAEYLPIYLPVIAEFGQFIAFFNDIISFYKETLVGDEEFNYICNLSNAKGITVKEAFKSVCEDVVNNVKNMKEILKNQPELLILVRTFMKSRAVFYATWPRYRLSEIPTLDKQLQQ